MPLVEDGFDCIKQWNDLYLPLSFDTIRFELLQRQGFFHLVDQGDEVDDLLGGATFMFLPFRDHEHIHEVAADMGQTAYMDDAGQLAQGIIADIAVGLNKALKVHEKVQSLPTAGGMIRKQDRGSLQIASHEGPHVGLAGIGLSRFIKHLDRCLIQVQEVIGQKLFLEQAHQGFAGFGYRHGL